MYCIWMELFLFIFFRNNLYSRLDSRPNARVLVLNNQTSETNNYFTLGGGGGGGEKTFEIL